MIPKKLRKDAVVPIAGALGLREQIEANRRNALKSTDRNRPGLSLPQ
jgi:hypothetical protein